MNEVLGVDLPLGERVLHSVRCADNPCGATLLKLRVAKVGLHEICHGFLAVPGGQYGPVNACVGAPNTLFICHKWRKGSFKQMDAT